MDDSRQPASEKDAGAPAGLSEVLLEAARPDLYKINAFRVMELPVDATPRDLAKRQQIVEMATNTGLEVPPGSGRALPLQDSADSHARREALQRLRDPERRLVDEFFWFWPHRLNESAGDEALQALARGEVEAARQIWGGQEREQSEANVSVHNLAVLMHAEALDLEERMANGSLPASQQRQLDDRWAQAFRRWKLLLEYENFWSRLTMRIRDLDDPRLTTGMARRMRQTLPMALLLINAQLAVRAAEQGSLEQARYHFRLIEESGFDREAVEGAIRKALGPVREMIKSLCRTAEAEANADPEHADRVTRWLLDQARPRLAVLDCLLPAGHPMRDSLHDDVAQQMLSCQISYGNRTKDWEVSLELLNLTLPIAAGTYVRARLEENIATVKTNIEYGRCWFCQQRNADERASVEVKMHGEVTRTPFFEYGRYGTRVNWRHTIINVPRCSVCQKAHAQSGKYGTVGGVIGSLVGLVSCSGITSGNSDATCGGIIVFIVCVIIGSSIGNAIGKARAPQGARPLTAMNDFPAVKELKAQGWQMGEKPAGVQ